MAEEAANGSPLLAKKRKRKRRPTKKDVIAVKQIHELATEDDKKKKNDNILQHGSGDNTNIITAYDGKKSIDYSPFLSSRIRDEENTSVSPTNVLCNKDKTVSTLCNKLYNNTNDKSPHKYPNNTATSSQL